MKVQKNIEVWLVKKRLPRPIDVVQGDKGIQLVFKVQDFTIPGGTTATLYVQKPSGKFVYQETGITVSENTITIDLENQAIIEHGNDIPYQVQLKNGADDVTTFAGIFRVEKSLKDAGAEESKTVIAAFEAKTAEQIAQIKAAAQEQIALIQAEFPELYAMKDHVTMLTNSTANAIKGNLSGSVVFADDVSPVEHNPVVVVFGKNIVKRTNTNATETNSGITYTVLEDGRVSASGTATATAYYILTGSTDWGYQAPIRKGVYTIPKAPAEGCRISVGIREKQNAERVLYYSTSTNTVTFEVTSEEARFDMILCVDTGYTVAGAIFEPQIEHGEIATDYEPYIDPSTVTVRRCGKNALNIPNKTSTITSTDGMNLNAVTSGGKIALNGVFNGGAPKAKVIFTDLVLRSVNYYTHASIIEELALKIPKGTYTFSANESISSGVASVSGGYLIVGELNGKVSDGTAEAYEDGSVVTVKSDNCYAMFIVYVYSDAAVENFSYTAKPQLEVGESATAFEPYNGAEYTPSADGTVPGITSLSPNMTILTDTDGVIVECEYNRDTKKYFENTAARALRLTDSVTGKVYELQIADGKVYAKEITL